MEFSRLRRVLSRLLFAAFALSLISFDSTGALAQFGFRHGSGAHFRASGGHRWSGHGWGGHRWGGHAGFGRWSGSGGYFHHGYAGRWPAFHRSWNHGYRSGFNGYGRHVYARPVYGGYGYGGYGSGGGYGNYGYGHMATLTLRHHATAPPRHGYGRQGYGQHGYGRHGYGHHGYGGHSYDRGGYGHGGYGRRGHGFFPHSTCVWPSERSAETVIVAGPRGAPPDPLLVPSLADLPVSLGIRSAPIAAPAIYTVGSGKGRSAPAASRSCRAGVTRATATLPPSGRSSSASVPRASVLNQRFVLDFPLVGLEVRMSMPLSCWCCSESERAELEGLADTR